MKSPSRFARLALISVVALLTSAAIGGQEQTEPNEQQRGLLYADLWVQTSGEYVACCLQTYGLAGDQVEREIKRIHAEEEGLAKEFRGPPPAVVMDLDETVLDNGTYQSFLYSTGQNHSTELFSKFVTEQRASIRLVPARETSFIAWKVLVLRSFTSQIGLRNWPLRQSPRSRNGASTPRVWMILPRFACCWKQTANRAKRPVAIWCEPNIE